MIYKIVDDLKSKLKSLKINFNIEFNFNDIDFITDYEIININGYGGFTTVNVYTISKEPYNNIFTFSVVEYRPIGFLFKINKLNNNYYIHIEKDNLFLLKGKKYTNENFQTALYLAEHNLDILEYSQIKQR
jgi:hypothetical protein